jgi:3-oxoacyl-[acyl-carrier-protein] synthase II
VNNEKTLSGVPNLQFGGFPRHGAAKLYVWHSGSDKLYFVKSKNASKNIISANLGIVQTLSKNMNQLIKDKYGSVVIPGISRITPAQYSRVIRNIHRTYTDIRSLYLQLLEESVFAYPIKHFGKTDPVSKMTCCAAALALNDAGIAYTQNQKNDMGILGTNSDGCLRANADYFRDYVESGRTLGRGNLFIYTLPSTPLADAAIHFGCQGPLIYMGFQNSRILSLLNHAKKMILRNEASAMLAVDSDETGALCFVLTQKADAPGENFLKIEDAAVSSQEFSCLEGFKNQ